MKRLAGLLMATIFLGGAVPASASPGVGLGAEQFGFIDWVEMNGDRGTFVGIIADRFVDPDSGGLVTVAGVFKGSCEKNSSGGFTIIACSGEGSGRQISHEDFEVDPLLSSATVSVKTAGQTHVGRWRGRGQAPFAGAGVGTDGHFYYAGAGMSRDCKGVGLVYGKRRTTNSWLDWAFLDQGAGAALYTGADLDVDFRNDRFFVTKTVRVAS